MDSTDVLSWSSFVDVIIFSISINSHMLPVLQNKSIIQQFYELLIILKGAREARA